MLREEWAWRGPRGACAVGRHPRGRNLAARHCGIGDQGEAVLRPDHAKERSCGRRVSQHGGLSGNRRFDVRSRFDGFDPTFRPLHALIRPPHDSDSSWLAYKLGCQLKTRRAVHLHRSPPPPANWRRGSGRSSNNCAVARAALRRHSRVPVLQRLDHPRNLGKLDRRKRFWSRGKRTSSTSDLRLSFSTIEHPEPCTGRSRLQPRCY